MALADRSTDGETEVTDSVPPSLPHDNLPRAVANAAAAIVSVCQSYIARRVWVIGVVLAVLTGGAVGLSIWDAHREAIEDASGDVRTLGTVLAEQTLRYVQVIDLLLQEVQSRTRDLDIRTPDELRRRLGSDDIHQWLGERIKNLPQAHAVVLVNADGSLLNTSLSTPLPRVSVAQRDYFQQARDHADGGVFVGAPVVRASTGALSIFLARRISGPDGGFLGLAVAVIDVDYLADFYKSVGRQQPYAVTLLRRDGVLLARNTMSGVTATSMPAASPWFAQVAEGGGIYRSSGYLTANRAVVSVSPLRDYPLVVDVSIRDSDALSVWWRQATYTAAGGVMLGATFIVLFWLIARQMRRQELHSATLSRTADALRESEARLTDFAQLASDWFWEQDAQLRLSWVGPGTPVRAPHDPDRLGKRRWEINDTSGDPERWEQHKQEILAHRPFHDFRYESTDQAGRPCHVSISGTPVHDGSGAFLGYRGIGRDITPQMEAEQELNRAKERAEGAEALLQDAIDSIAEGFVIYDAEDRLVTANESYRRLYPTDTPWVPGMTFAEILRHGLARGHYPDAIGHEQEWLEAWLQRHREAASETEQPLSDGRWLLVTKRRMRNGGVAGLRIDITALKQAQAALRDSEAHLEQAQEIAGIGSWEMDAASGRYIWSRQLYRIRGLPVDFQPTRDNLESTPHPDDAQRRTDWLADLRAGRERDPIEMRVKLPNGDMRTLRLQGRSVVDPDGVIRRLVGTVQDVTERRLIEQQLVQAQKMEAIGNLTGGMAHDFNNVLGVIIGNLDLLKRRVGADAEAAELCGEALDGAAHCGDLIQRLLAFARRQPLRPERIDANALIGDTGRLLGRTLGEQIRLTLRLDPMLWPVMADQAQLEAALVNLATNARDAMPRGGKLDICTRNVSLDAGSAPLNPEVGPGNYAVIEISDTGTGIPPEIIGRIFEPFFTTKAPGKGTGLGLSMAFGFVKQSGGHLTVYSEPGLGTTFRLYLPRDDAGAADVALAPDADAVVGGDATVLVVEDNAQLRRAVVRQLAELGYQVREAEHADAALAILSNDEPVDLLFTDVVMAGTMNGLDLALLAVRLRRRLRVLLTSGFPGVGGVDERMANSPFPLLHKPYRRDELARAVREVLDQADPATIDPLRAQA